MPGKGDLNSNNGTPPARRTKVNNYPMHFKKKFLKNLHRITKRITFVSTK